MGLPMKPIEKCQFCGVRDWEQFQLGRAYLWRCANCGHHPGRQANKWACANWFVGISLFGPLIIGLGIFLFIVISCNNSTPNP